MNLKPYPEYKYAGVPWLGAAPGRALAASPRVPGARIRRKTTWL